MIPNSKEQPLEINRLQYFQKSERELLLINRWSHEKGAHLIFSLNLGLRLQTESNQLKFQIFKCKSTIDFSILNMRIFIKIKMNWRFLLIVLKWILNIYFIINQTKKVTFKGFFFNWTYVHLNIGSAIRKIHALLNFLVYTNMLGICILLLQMLNGAVVFRRELWRIILYSIYVYVYAYKKGRQTLC